MKPIYIIEDEPLMLKYYSQFVNYEDLGIKIAGLYSDAESAFEDIKNNPGIVVTDINMPGMNGLELIENLKKEDNSSTFIILSGYDDFHLVKQAFKLGVTDYLLKSEINETMYMRLLKRIIASENIKSVEEASFVAKDDILKQFLWGHIFEDSKYSKLKFKNDSLKGIVVSKIVNWNEIVKEEWLGDKELLQCGVFNVVSEIIADYQNCEFFFDSYDKLILIIEVTNENSNSLALEIAMKIKNSLEKIFNYSVYTGFSGVSSERKKLTQFLFEAEKMVKYSFSTGNWFNEYKEKYTTILPIDVFELNKKFQNQLVFLGMKEEFVVDYEVFPKVFSVDDTDNIIRLYADYIYSLKKSFSKYEVFFEEIDSCYFYRNSAEQLSDYIISKLSEINSKLRSQDNIMQVVEDYIKKNYNYNITLQTIADKFNIDYFYLSRRFIPHFNMSFRKFINKVRMEKAMEFIQKSDLKLKDIAEMTGYENYENFSKTFSKYFGKTPTDFVKMRNDL